MLADWKKDFDGTLKAVAQMGYEGVELTQYESWTPARGREVRTLLDSLKLKVFATHTEPEYFVPGDKMKAAIELNHILGTQTVCCVRGLGTTPTGIGYHAKASAETDAWKELTDVLQKRRRDTEAEQDGVQLPQPCSGVSDQGRREADRHSGASEGPGFHIDVNVCRRAGADPVEFMKQYPGKTECLLLTDGPAGCQPSRAGVRQGRSPWKDVFAAAESVGGVKYYLLTHGATEMTPLETVKRDLEQYKLIHG